MTIRSRASDQHPFARRTRFLLPTPVALLIAVFCIGVGGSSYLFAPAEGSSLASVATAEAAIPPADPVASSTPPALPQEVLVPGVSASGYLVTDMESGRVIANKDSYDQAPIASLTKLITALVVDDHFDLDTPIVVPREALVYTVVPRLKAGEVVRASDLLFLMLQESSNEASEALASSVGRDEFLGYMNEEARTIGLAHTSLNDPSGIKNDMSTPADLFALLRYIGARHPSIFDITSGRSVDPRFGALNDFNILKGVPEKLVGGKVGQTNQAGDTYAGIFSLEIGGQTRQMAVVVLGSRQVEADVRDLLGFARSHALAP